MFIVNKVFQFKSLSPNCTFATATSTERQLFLVIAWKSTRNVYRCVYNNNNNNYGYLISADLRPPVGTPLSFGK
jgi:hypothetical protein